MASADIFARPIGTAAPPSNIVHRKDHPVPRLGVTMTPPISTNKFYANFFLGGQTSPTYLHPYAVSWAAGRGSSASWGMSISHTTKNQHVYGPANAVTGSAKFFINPVGIQSICISAKELGASTALTSDMLTDLSARISLRPSAHATPVIHFPLIQGSAFITAVFNGGTPLIQSGVFFKTVTRANRPPKSGVTKYRVWLEDGNTWLVYAHSTKGESLNLHVVNNGLAQASGAFHGTIQVAKDPGGGEALYDQACGVYATGSTLSGTVTGSTGSYTFTFAKAGLTAATLLMFALPHHQSSFDDTTRGKMTRLKLQTTTKGMATAVAADTWTMVEPDVPVTLGFMPHSASAQGEIRATLSDAARSVVLNVANQEVKQDMKQQTDLNSMYYSGKALAKFAAIILTLHDVLGETAMAKTELNQLKAAFATFQKNKQQFPLVYESAWGGLVSSASYVTGNSGADFGNTYYNDHHFHYGYFIYCAAVIGHIDSSWIHANKDYVNALVRDIANPSHHDKFFPVSRAFDWFHGHSWAHGLFDTLDGKDQESSSEDTMHSYAIKLWGAVIGDHNMAARGSLMLAVQARSMQSYYLYQRHNTVEPANFIGNKCAGILFENKIDHTTYFGNNIEYIQGIHMLPLMPHTPLIRTPAFVREEWDTYFSNGRADQVVGGWKGILYGNYATIDPHGAYSFFSSADFDPSFLDGGASLTWYLAFAASLGRL